MTQRFSKSGGNPRRHEENMQTLRGTGVTWESNPELFVERQYQQPHRYSVAKTHDVINAA